MPTVLITGAARGLGLEFAKQYAADGWDVIGTARGEAPQLAATGATVLPLDMGDLEAVAEFGEKVDRSLDLVIANAGIYGPARAKSAEDGRGWIEVLTVNTVAPTLLAQALRPKLAEGAKVVAISSEMGSIAGSSTGSIPYRASKAALNMAWHVIANERRADGIIVALLHPGWVQTDMGGPGATIDAPTSVNGLRRVIDGLNIDGSGGFFSWDGRELPW